MHIFKYERGHMDDFKRTYTVVFLLLNRYNLFFDLIVGKI